MRRTGEFRGGSMKRDRGHKPECFNFLRGRCYRGSSCRYLHHGAGSDGSRRKRWGPQNTELPSGLGHSDVIKETCDNPTDASNRVDYEAKKRRSHHSLSMHSGSFDAMEIQKVEERNDLDNVEKDEQGIADQSQQGTVQDAVKDLSTGIPYITKFKKVEIHGLMSDADAMTTHGKTLDSYYPMTSSVVPFQVSANAVVSANSMSHPKNSACAYEPLSDENLPSSPGELIWTADDYFLVHSIGTFLWIVLTNHYILRATKVSKAYFNLQLVRSSYAYILLQFPPTLIPMIGTFPKVQMLGLGHPILFTLLQRRVFLLLNCPTCDHIFHLHHQAALWTPPLLPI